MQKNHVSESRMGGRTSAGVPCVLLEGLVSVNARESGKKGTEK